MRACRERAAPKAFPAREAAESRASPGRGDPDLKRIDPDRLDDVLELGLAEIADLEVEPRAHLPVGVLGQTDRARAEQSPPIARRY